MRIDTIIMVDWSARSAPSPRKPTKDAIFISEVGPNHRFVTYCQTRDAAHRHLEARFDEAIGTGRRVLAGFDFPFGYPKGFAHAVTGSNSIFDLWSWLAAHIKDDARNANNRLCIADTINALFPQAGPFWSHPAKATPQNVPFRKPPHVGFSFAERRSVEKVATGASTCFQLYGNGAVGSQTLLGVPRLQALRQRYGTNLAVRPFERQDAPIVLAEVYPSILTAEVKHRQRPNEILDAAQVRVLAEAFAGLNRDLREKMLLDGDQEEGWIAGLGHEAELRDALSKRPSQTSPSPAPKA